MRQDLPDTTSKGEQYRTRMEMIAYCGLDCKQCDAYIATVNDDQKLRKETALLWSTLNAAPILPEHINCEGCRAGGVKTVYCASLCAVRKCAIKKEVTTCGDCPELMACRLVAPIISENTEALRNLTQPK